MRKNNQYEFNFEDIRITEEDKKLIVPQSEDDITQDILDEINNEETPRNALEEAHEYIIWE